MKKIFFFSLVILFLASCGKQVLVQNNENLNQPTATACAQDSDCKLIYSYCTCEAVPQSDSRKNIVIPGEPMCDTNTCQRYKSQAICDNKQCVKFTHAPELSVNNDDILKQIASGIELAESAAPEIPLPAGIKAGQIMKYFKLGNTYLALVLQPSLNVLLPDLTGGFTPSFVGLLAAREDHQAWTQLLKLADQKPTDKNNPYYLWLKDSKIFLSVVDQNGAGSGEGMMKVLTIDDKSHWVLDGCYYFNGNYTDGDYFIFSQYLDKAEAKPLSECSKLQWEE